MKNTRPLLPLFSIMKEYFARQFTHHPARCTEIMHIMRKYQIHHVIAQLGTLHWQENQELPSDTQLAHCIHAENLAKALEELGTCFIKLGQIISTRPDLLPSPYITALARLQHTVAPVAGAQIAAIIEYDLDAPLMDLFQSFDPEPLATASIAQVHKAVLHDGTYVVIKVQRPGVRQQVEMDIEILQEIARFMTKRTRIGARYNLIPIVQEIKQSLIQELDFRQEADNTLNVSQNIREFRSLMTPIIYPAYSSQQVLVLSFISGRHLAQISQDELGHFAPTTIAKELLSAYLKQIIVNGIFHCDPHPGNILLANDGRLALLDFGMVGRLETRQIDTIILLLLAFSECQGERVAELYLEMIDVPERFDRRAFVQEICTLVGRYHDISKKGIEIGRALLELINVASTYRTSIPTNFTLLGKTLLNLDGTLRLLAPNLNLTQVLRHSMQQVIQQRIVAQVSAGRSLASLLEARHVTENMLRNSNIILEKLSHDQPLVHVQVGQLDETIQRAARRVSLSVIASSLIVSMMLLFTTRRQRNSYMLGKKAANKQHRI